MFRFFLAGHRSSFKQDIARYLGNIGLQYMVIGLHFIQGLGEGHVFIKGEPPGTTHNRHPHSIPLFHSCWKDMIHTVHTHSSVPYLGIFLLQEHEFKCSSAPFFLQKGISATWLRRSQAPRTATYCWDRQTSPTTLATRRTSRGFGHGLGKSMA